MIASATPDRMQMLASSSRADKTSDRNAVAPTAAMTGTVSWTTAAWVGVRPGKARYQIA
ncbi:hypothetical protein D9M70_636810 [compost metagenome]